MPNANIGFNTSQNKAVIKARTPHHCSSKIKKIPIAISMEALPYSPQAFQQRYC